MKKNNYRIEIDSLRAIAVILVIIYHMDFGIFTGGFIGVDVFFVISGYLITKQIITNYSKKNFIFIFYFKRARRLLPALLLVLTTVFIIGYLFFFNSEFLQLNKHIFGGVFFVLNFILSNEIGYFDKEAITKPLLHLWSLSIEEQFYIIWPFLLLIFLKWKKNIMFFTVLIILISFFLNELHSNQNYAFFSLHTRLWEILTGGLIAQIELKNPKIFEKYRIKRSVKLYLNKVKLSSKYSSYLGLSLIFAAALTFNDNNGYDQWKILLPILGTSIIILNPTNIKIFSNRILRYIGLISYPLYLWHWPLLSIAYYTFGNEVETYTKVFIVIISFILSSITFHSIEKPLRSAKRSFNYTIAIIAFILILGSINGINSKSNFIDFRKIDRSFSSIMGSLELTVRDDCFEIPYAYKLEEDWSCTLGDNKKNPEIFIAGDSHAQTLIPIFDLMGKEKSLSFEFAGTSGCPHLLGIQSERGKLNIEKYNCKKLNEKIFNYIKENNFKTILLFSRWGYYTPCFVNCRTNRLSVSGETYNTAESFIYGLNKTISEYDSIGVNIIFMHDNPQQINDPMEIIYENRNHILNNNYSEKEIETLFNKYSVDIDSHQKDRKWINNIILNIKKNNFNKIRIDNYLCGEKKCKLMFNGRFIYGDDDHLSIFGAEYLYSLIKDDISDLF